VNLLKKEKIGNQLLVKLYNVNNSRINKITKF
jgi:hypothetical protein